MCIWCTFSISTHPPPTTFLGQAQALAPKISSKSSQKGQESFIPTDSPLRRILSRVFMYFCLRFFTFTRDCSVVLLYPLSFFLCDNKINTFTFLWVEERWCLMKSSFQMSISAQLSSRDHTTPRPAMMKRFTAMTQQSCWYGKPPGTRNRILEADRDHFAFTYQEDIFFLEND